MHTFFMNLAINKRREYIFKAIMVILALVGFLPIISMTGTAKAKSLYVLSDIDASPNPLRTYDIAANGTLTYQAQYSLPRYNLGATGITMDSDSGYLFVTYVYWNYIILVNSKTMITVPEMVEAPGAWDLAGIVYNHKKSQLYCVARGTNSVWVYDWNPKTVTLTLVNGLPFALRNASAYGIAIDEVNQLLYVANSTNTIYAYSTDNWSLKQTITLNHNVVCVAVDVKNGYLYAGGGYVGNPYLTQYKLYSNTQSEILVEPDASAGVMGIAVDPNTSNVYCTTGNDYLPGGDNIRVYDKLLSPIDVEHINGNPTSLVIPGKEAGYNPLELKKKVVKVLNGDDLTETDSANVGDLVTYRICLSNNEDTENITNVSIVDNLPDNVSYISASDDGVIGHYDPITHKYTWTYPSIVKESSICLDITVKINQDVLPVTKITNSVTASTNTTLQTTATADIITASNPLNIQKTVFGAIPGQTKWVDVNEVITYNIYVDNKENSFAATDVLIVDTLPDDVVLLKADDDFPGVYDSDSHTFTWSISSLAPQDSVDLGITMRLKESVSDGTIVTNTVTAQSVETVISESSVVVRTGEGPLLVDNVEVIPSTIRREGALSDIMVILEMPQGYQVTDIKNTPLILSLVSDYENITVAANGDQIISQSNSKTYVVTSFNKNLVMNAIPGYGPKNIQIVGTLANGSTFIGYATIIIAKTEDISGYISGIDIKQTWDYGDPTDTNDFMYEFCMNIHASGGQAINMDADVNNIKVRTPSGFTFRIPKLPNQTSDGVWTSYEYSIEDWDGQARWEYRARMKDPVDLKVYGDGKYTITLNYKNGDQCQTTAKFSIPDTNQPIPQPVQEPIFTFPSYGQKVESPLTFTWEPCTDKDVNDIMIEMMDQENSIFHEQHFYANETSWGPFSLTEGKWEIDINFEQYMDSYNNDGILISAAKRSKSKCEFTILDYPYIKYEVWGGDIYLSGDSFDSRYWFANELEANGYVKLGESNGQTATFPGEYRYYIISTWWQFNIDSIRGTDDSYLSLKKITHRNTANVTDSDNIFGPPDGLYATIGKEPWYGDAFSGYFVFNNPGNWEGLTVITGNLNIGKSIINSPEEIENLDPNDTITYNISFNSNDLVNTVMDVTVIDYLPDEVSFISANSDKIPGKYNPNTHTYTWYYPVFSPESIIENQLIVQLNPDAAPDTTITNFVVIDSNEMPPTTASASFYTPLNPDLSITPNILRRQNGTVFDITAVLQLPISIKADDIKSLTLYPDIYSGKILPKGTIQVTNTDNGSTIIAIFNKADILNAIPGYGSFNLRIEGILKSGKTFFDEQEVWITRFTGY